MPWSDQEFVHGPPFAARYSGGECAAEGDEIEEGDRIVMIDGEAAHAECVDHGECPENSTCE